MATPMMHSAGTARTNRAEPEVAISVMNWVLEEAPDLPAHCFGVLMALASKAREDGTCAYPGQEWLAERARKSDRQVRSDLTKLEQLGLIRRGDQSAVQHIVPDERPVVWDLAIEKRARKSASARTEGRAADQPESASARKPTSARKQASGRSAASSRNAEGPEAHFRRRERKSTSATDRKPTSAYTSFDRSSSLPSEESMRARATELGCQLLNEHLAAMPAKTPRDVIQHTGQKIDQLLAEDFGADLIREALGRLRGRRKVGPGLLPNLLHDILTERASPNGNTPARSADRRFAPGSGPHAPPPGSHASEEDYV